MCHCERARARAFGFAIAPNACRSDSIGFANVAMAFRCDVEQRFAVFRQSRNSRRTRWPDAKISIRSIIDYFFFSVVVFVVVHCRFAKVKGASSLPRTIHLFGGMEFLLSVHCSRFPVLQQVHYIRNCCTISVNRSRANQQQQNNIMNGFNFISQSAHLMVFAQNVWVSNTIYMASICFFLLLFQS